MLLFIVIIIIQHLGDPGHYSLYKNNLFPDDIQSLLFGQGDTGRPLYSAQSERLSTRHTCSKDGF